MSDFKLIAIRPLEGCDKRFSKNLVLGVVYKFYNDYEFTIEGDAVTAIEYKSTIPEGLYDLRIKDRVNPLKVSISAVVGKNGSGKSTLFELLFLSIYNLAAWENILTYTLKNEGGVVITKSYEVETEVLVEIYYSIDNQYFCLNINKNSKLGLVEINKIPDKISNQLGKIRYSAHVPAFKESSLLIKNLSNYFFYTIAINYSFYGLNAGLLGDWVESLFHKNDGYQTPIVINPMRTAGIIDVNKENSFVYQRLLANILEPVSENIDIKDTVLNLANDKVVSRLVLQLNSEKVEKYKEDKELKTVSKADECLAKLYYVYTGITINTVPVEPEMQTTYFYALYKIQNICRVYKRYQGFVIDDAFDDIDGFIEAIVKDQSHITFKLKQALNFLRYRHIRMDGTHRPFDVELKVLSDLIVGIKSDALKQGRKLSTIELLPPSIFDVKIEFVHHGSFDDLSSGEKQKIYSITSIIYHLINLNSVFKNGETTGTLDKNRYKYVGIIFDEVELYFHPEFQQAFISDLLSYLEKINPVLIDRIEGINICFSTHSPFILSDIPNQNILRLMAGEPEPYVESEKTFGANIHDLLASDFFLTEGYIGHFAKKSLDNLLENLTIERELSAFEKARLQKVISIVGEPLIKDRLQELFDEKFKTDNELREQLLKISKILASRR